MDFSCVLGTGSKLFIPFYQEGLLPLPGQNEAQEG